MKHDKFTPSLLLVSLLCLTCAPLSTAQPRQAQPRAPRQTAQPRRRPTTTTRPVATPAQQPSPQPAQSPARRETERSFDSLVAAESYGIYAEMRSVGQFLRSEDFRRAAEALQVLAGPNSLSEQAIVESLFFLATHAEALKDARLVLAAMPTRESIPDGMFALEFSSVEAASSLEPKLRNFMSRQTGAATQRSSASAGRAAKTRHATSDNTPNTEGGDTPSRAEKEVERPVQIRRVANIIFSTDRAFTLKAIGGTGLPSLAEDMRFQSVRSRFSSDPIFIYLDIARLTQASRRSREKYEQQRAEYESQSQQTQSTIVTADPGTTPVDAMLEPSIDVTMSQTSTDEIPELEPGVAVVMDEGVDPHAGDDPVNVVTDEDAALQTQATAEESGLSTGAGAVTNSSEFMSAFIFDRLLGGIPRWPETVGFSIGFDGDDYVLRALASNAPGGRHSIIPLLPAFVSGPVTTLEASAVAPAGTDIFAAASIDWRQVYEAILNPGPEFVPPPPAMTTGDAGEVDGGEVEEAKPAQTREQAVEALEKVLGFKIKEEFLPALGHEIAFSAPLSWWHVKPSFNPDTKSAAADNARPGPILIASLSNPDAMRKMLPRLLAAGSISMSNTVEKRAGFEINTSSGISYAFVNNYLVLAYETSALRHFADTVQQQGLISNQNFRAATTWQPRQKIGQVYISPTMIETFIAEARKWADPSDPELEALFARLNIRPTATSYAVTDEGDGRLFHELRLPKSLITIFSTQSAIFLRQSSRIQNETMAMTYLRSVHMAEQAFKSTMGKGSYASLDELTTRLGRRGSWPHLSKDELEQAAYKIELTISGTGFQATATPKEYGRNARRSFFIDESGVLRGADRKGEPATADDPPVD
ncbi:MAG TPA: DUF3352 domain-containing protein [Pyrinomonadaceae bacterium]|nr:DUF3352 domain-containing protein [Pyrinomonadaceae bacterium]